MTATAYRPGKIITLKSAPPNRSQPTDSGVAFMVGLTSQGPTSRPQLIHNMSEWLIYFGVRTALGASLYDSAETYFREGGNQLYVMRVVGPNPVTATLILKDTAAANAITVNAENPGAWGLGLKIQVIAGQAASSTRIQVWDTTGTILLDQSPDLLTHLDAVNWSQTSLYVNIVDLGTGLPQLNVAAQAALTGSATGDEANAVDAQYLNALNFIDTSFGPGQVMIPGRTTDPAHTQLVAHAAANNRIALLDVSDSATTSSLLTSAATVTTTGNGKYAAIFGPWLTIPGLTPNTVRTIPASGFAAALMARNDSQNSPAVPAAGNNGQAQFVLTATQNYTDANRDALNTAGFNVIRNMLGGVRIYGYRTVADPVNDPYNIQLGQARLLMEIVAQIGNIMENHLFKLMDGRGIEFAALAGDLNALLIGYYNDNSLYGDTPDDAFSIDTSSNVNTPTTVQNGELHAQVGLRMTPFAELVYVDIIKIPVTQSL